MATSVYRIRHFFLINTDMLFSTGTLHNDSIIIFFMINILIKLIYLLMKFVQFVIE